MKDLNRLPDTELKIKGIDALNNALGIAGALKFLMLLHREPTNYVEISRTLYQNQSIDKIFARASAKWVEQSAMK
ncbi:conserved hypothetical protein [Beggiatoa sp. PS]|nr:conserved hypothetical protein [Beggiatoa sp. PS]